MPSRGRITKPSPTIGRKESVERAPEADLAPHQFARKLPQLPIDGLRLLGPEQRLDARTWFGAATEMRFAAHFRFAPHARELAL
ncbi:MAG: hypothetical protein M3020_16820, partial [Myxococcota bacterium]|nr:hypothetical protein [Myxococcota bacterium]